MTDRHLPRAVRHNLSVQKFGSETLLYHQRRHLAFCLNETSSTVWELANGERTLDELTSSVSAALNVTVDPDLIRLAIHELRVQELIEPDEDTSARQPISRRDILLKLGAASAALLPIIASIAAPTAAQAYSGCVDCSVAPGRPARRIRRAPATPLGPPQ